MSNKTKMGVLRKRLFAVGSAIAAAGIAGFLLFSADGSTGMVEPDEEYSDPALEIAKPAAASLSDIILGTKTAEMRVRPGDSLAGMLGKFGIQYNEVEELSATLRPIMGARGGLKAGADLVRIRYKPTENGSPARLEEVSIIRSPAYKIVAERRGERFEAGEFRSALTTHLARRSGTIAKGASLIETAQSKDVPYNIIDKFYETFSFDVDFERDIYPGDTWSVMYEKLYSEDGEYIGNGEMLYASLYLNSRGKELRLYRYENERGVSGYFDENGKSASKSLKKTPINGARISSKYGMRRHPVLGFSRQHKGVDFAAPHGTPIPAGGSGTVTARGWDSGYGNYVKIRHNGSYSTLYGHMSSFRKGIVAGARVAQGQIIGYVGSTGLSTGPHLHYEIHRDGTAVNPLAVRLPSTIQLPVGELARFENARDKLDMQFTILDRNLSPVAAIIGK